MNVSSFGRRLLAAANGTFAGTIIGLGTAAFKNTGTSGNTVPLLDGTNTASGVWTFSAKPSLTGGAISFPATQVASAGANDLDDYEEGSWTPGISFGGGTTGITYTTQSGLYVKIGSLVFVVGRVTLSAKGSSTGNANITGLPFSPSVQSATSFGYFANLSGLTGFPLGFSAGTAIVLRQGAAATASNLTETHFTNTSDLGFSTSFTT